MTAPRKLPCRFILEPTGETGLHSGRPRYRVECTVCGVLVHEATTGPSQAVEAHFAGKDYYAVPLDPQAGANEMRDRATIEALKIALEQAADLADRKGHDLGTMTLDEFQGELRRYRAMVAPDWEAPPPVPTGES